MITNLNKTNLYSSKIGLRSKKSEMLQQADANRKDMNIFCCSERARLMIIIKDSPKLTKAAISGK